MEYVHNSIYIHLNANMNQKKIEMALSIAYKVDFRASDIITDKVMSS